MISNLKSRSVTSSFLFSFFVKVPLAGIQAALYFFLMIDLRQCFTSRFDVLIFVIHTHICNSYPGHTQQIREVLLILESIRKRKSLDLELTYKNYS